MVREADVLVYLEDVQYTRRDWRNRNLIQVNGKRHWLTIPVLSSGRYHETIDSVRVSDSNWPQVHLSTLRHSYGRFIENSSILALLEAAYTAISDQPYLSLINRSLLDQLFNLLGIQVVTRTSHKLAPGLNGSERILGICQAVNASTYITGPAARSYLNEQAFAKAQINIDWVDYSRLPPATHWDSNEYSIVHLLLKYGLETGQIASTFQVAASR